MYLNFFNHVVKELRAVVHKVGSFCEALSGGLQKQFFVYNFPINYKKKLFKFYIAICHKTSRLCAIVHHRELCQWLIN